jgi:UDP-N-acetylmuramoyl-L-alanyl-D-glutamate--2,6-diaminopimelate ligase
MEVSSHALELRRTLGINFETRVFTNLTPEHLDFHPTMEDYFNAKKLLFRGPGASVVNVDDAFGARLADELGDAVTFGVDSEGAAYRAVDVSFDWAGSSFTCQMPDGRMDVATRLPGGFNVLNVLGAIATARAMGVDAALIPEALSSAERVPGRFEPVDEGQAFGVLVDYAHTPDSLDNVLRAARELTGGRLHVVFGAGGDRDKAKRPLMGRVAEARADRVIVTSDNPRSEEPAAIVDEVMVGAPGAEREVDRRVAIAQALRGAEAGDVVVIAGKGHEQGQEFENGRKEPFDDRSVAAQELRALEGAPT